MTASIITSSPRIAVASRTGDRFAGTRALFRKDIADWRHGRRMWVILAVVSAFMVLAAANSWIITQVVAAVPGAEAPDGPISMAPLDNVLTGVGTQIFIFAAIFASMSLIVAERERGTLAWVASKSVGRGGIIVAKAASATAVIAVTAALLPLAIAAVVATVLYGAPAVMPVVSVAAGMVGAIAFFVVLNVAVSTVVANQAAVAAIAFGVMFLPGLLAMLIPFEIAPFLPTSILDWSVGLALGAPVGFVTPIAWALSIVALAAAAIWRVDKLEL